MIKILHTADLHIGMENYGRLDPVSGMHSRLVDYLERFDEAIDHGLAEQVDAVIIAGDIYKNRTPNPTHQREFARRIRRIREAGLPILMITGNHDISPAAGRAHAVEIFETLAVDGVVIADRPRTYQIETRAGRFQAVTLPWVTRHHLLTREELRLMSFLEIETELLRRIDGFLQAACGQLDPTMPAVIVAHGTVQGATTGAEQQLLLGRDLMLPRGNLAHANVDYVAMGHIHSHQQIGQHPPIVYPGSIERIDFGEESEQKGVVIVELRKGATAFRFVPLAARPFVTIDLDVRANSDPQTRIQHAIEQKKLTQAVVRVRVKITTEQAGVVQSDDIRNRLVEAGAYLVASVSVETERTYRGRVLDPDQHPLEGLTPRAALQRYLEDKRPPLSKERIAALLDLADSLPPDQNSIKN